jgi:hypothetical protein
VRVITPKGRAAEGRAAAQATVTVLPRLEAYTGIPYAFGKLDHVGIPESNFSAVENPGLISYRFPSLLIPPEGESPRRLRALRDLEAHEIAHQWFGNLVTQADWRDVWLSEGFATWLGYKVMDQEQPLERARVTTIAARERIMQEDASARARPVRLAMETRAATEDTYNRRRVAGRDCLPRRPARVSRSQPLRHRVNRRPGGGAAPRQRHRSGPRDARVSRHHRRSRSAGRDSLRPHRRRGYAASRTKGRGRASGVLARGRIHVGLRAARSACARRLAERLTLVYDLRMQPGTRQLAREVLGKLAADRDPMVSTAAREALK